MPCSQVGWQVKVVDTPPPLQGCTDVSLEPLALLPGAWYEDRAIGWHLAAGSFQPHPQLTAKKDACNCMLMLKGLYQAAEPSVTHSEEC